MTRCDELKTDPHRCRSVWNIAAMPSGHGGQRVDPPPTHRILQIKTPLRSSVRRAAPVPLFRRTTSRTRPAQMRQILKQLRADLVSSGAPIRRAILAWSKDHRVEWPTTRRAGQCRTAIESINGRMRDELLNESLFFGFDHARSAIAEWVQDYNTARPHASLGRRRHSPGSSPQPVTTLRSTRASRLRRLLNPRPTA